MINVFGKSCCSNSGATSSLGFSISEDGQLPETPDRAAPSSAVRNTELSTFVKGLILVSGRKSPFMLAAQRLEAYKEFKQATSRNEVAAKQALEEIHEILEETGTPQNYSHSVAVSVSVFLGMLTIMERFVTLEVPKFISNPGEYFLGNDWDFGIPDYSGIYYGTPTSSTTSTTTAPNSDVLKGLSFSIHVMFTMATIVACCTTLYQCTKQKPSRMLFKKFFENLFGQTSIIKPLKVSEVKYLITLNKKLSLQKEMRLSSAKETVAELMTSFDDEFLEFVKKVSCKKLKDINMQVLGRVALEKTNNNPEQALLLAVTWLLTHYDKSGREMGQLLEEGLECELSSIPDFMQQEHLSTTGSITTFLINANHADLVDWYRVLAIGEQLINSNSDERTKRLISSLQHSVTRLTSNNTQVNFNEFINVAQFHLAQNLYKTEGNTSAIRSWIGLLQNKGSSLSRGQIRG